MLGYFRGFRVYSNGIIQRVIVIRLGGSLLKTVLRSCSLIEADKPESVIRSYGCGEVSARLWSSRYGRPLGRGFRVL